MINIFLFSQNLKLDSFTSIVKNVSYADKNIFLSPHMLYENEKIFLENIFSNCEYIKFADILCDSEAEACDINSYSENMTDVFEYYNVIKKKKNELISNKVLEQYKLFKGYILSSDLGIDRTVWKKKGFVDIKGDYYFICETNLKNQIKKKLKKNKYIYKLYKNIVQAKKKNIITEDVYVSRTSEMKYVFLGKMDRIAYRMNLKWEKSNEERIRLQDGKYGHKTKCQYLSTLHEAGKCVIPDREELDVRYIQDGYLPANYSSMYLKFKPSNVKYYAWDIVGEENFKLFKLPISIMPFRKKLYMPKAEFRPKVKTVLVATSGPGDWTAQKNRSDEDLMLHAFVEIAKQFPDIEFIYRCHPTWVHPEHNGVNSINRAGEYINFSGLKNIYLSSNIPGEELSSFILSFPRSSLKEDLSKADIVFGEHSVSMIDAAFENIPFSSVNLTNRRNLFQSITDLGFPHCNSIGDITATINNYSSQSFQEAYNEAIDHYNKMTDMTD